MTKGPDPCMIPTRIRGMWTYLTGETRASLAASANHLPNHSFIPVKLERTSALSGAFVVVVLTFFHPQLPGIVVADLALSRLAGAVLLRARHQVVPQSTRHDPRARVPSRACSDAAQREDVSAPPPLPERDLGGSGGDGTGGLGLDPLLIALLKPHIAALRSEGRR
jgi:hypothetical protein